MWIAIKCQAGRRRAARPGQSTRWRIKWAPGGPPKGRAPSPCCDGSSARRSIGAVQSFASPPLIRLGRGLHAIARDTGNWRLRPWEKPDMMATSRPRLVPRRALSDASLEALIYRAFVHRTLPPVSHARGVTSAAGHSRFPAPSRLAFPQTGSARDWIRRVLALLRERWLPPPENASLISDHAQHVA